MELNTIAPEVKKKTAKRVGRGIGSGTGKTSGRGHKGQKSRAGGYHKVGFEGGQMPLQRRVPKFGFKNINRINYRIINLDNIQKLIDEKKISKELNLKIMEDMRFIKPKQMLKVLGKGKLNSSIKVFAHKFSDKAKSEIESKGGEALLI